MTRVLLVSTHRSSFMKLLWGHYSLMWYSCSNKAQFHDHFHRKEQIFILWLVQRPLADRPHHPICIFSFRTTDRLNRKLEMQNEVTIEEGEMEKKIESKVLVNPFSPKCSSSSVAWQKSTFFIKCTYFCIYRQRTLHCSRGTTHDNVWRYKGHLFLILMMEKEWMNLRLKLT